MGFFPLAEVVAAAGRTLSRGSRVAVGLGRSVLMDQVSTCSSFIQKSARVLLARGGVGARWCPDRPHFTRQCTRHPLCRSGDC